MKICKIICREDERNCQTAKNKKAISKFLKNFNMQDSLYPKQNKSQEIGTLGQAYFHFFVVHKLGWIYRPTPQEADFGVDGYIDIKIDENVIGKSVAVQVKCGETYISKRTEGGIKYEGKISI
ncbi:MAG: hypothetical protein DCF32_07175 [Leptolyngbya sp.]|nr:MAG: hypothetical protein DCF32_07175 [Leptolyngbya sp.]